MSLTLQQVKQLFDDMSVLSCDPSNAVSPCIPFMYPFNGCWARAHDMCRRMLAQGITSQKVWIHGYLTVKSANSSNCTVNWGWHVAPIVDVDLGNGPQSYVIDPSIFDEPVPQAVWASVQGDPNAMLTVTSWTIYIGNTTDPYAYNQPDPWLDADLTYYRSALQNESPPPPYAVCNADVYSRDNLQDTGVTPLANGGISMSPDVNHYQQQLADPRERSELLLPKRRTRCSSRSNTDRRTTSTYGCRTGAMQPPPLTWICTIRFPRRCRLRQAGPSSAH